MPGIDPEAFSHGLQMIDDGFVFETFAKDFLGKILGYEFNPVGGIHDRGIDGLEHTFHRKGFDRWLYQISIEKDPRSKIEKTLKTLKKNKIRFQQLYFVSNRVFPNIDQAIDELYHDYKRPIRIYDLNWLATRVNTSEGTVASFYTFVESYLHEFKKPGRSFEVADLDKDPRLFVFLRQQWEEYKNELRLEEILADSLILYSLEGTDPDKGIFKTALEIKQSITTHIKFDPKLLDATIDKRLSQLTIKPRRITFHSKAQAYCLPFETRVEIESKNLKEAALYNRFNEEVEKKLQFYLADNAIRVKDCLGLIQKTIHRIFYSQGLEFADFILTGENQASVEKQLSDTIAQVVDNSSVVPPNREKVKTALLVTIRDLVYNGSPEQKMFLRALSNTYMTLFLLQCDPKISTYFSTMAGKLRVYVCTSIIVPAMSEVNLDPVNRRHWNLLKRASDSGVTLLVNRTIINELVAHLKLIKTRYEEQYKDSEKIYLMEELHTLYIDEIMIRAYFYAKMRNQVRDFSEFLENFIDSRFTDPEADLVQWLRDTFRIEFVSDDLSQINMDEEKRLFEELEKRKKDRQRARTDARLILTIYAVREKNLETAKSGIFGYQTWWLSKDVITYQAVNKVFKDKYKISCYIRPDFLYNYISLSPSKVEVDLAYEELFPSLLGVNISFHLPKEVSQSVHGWIEQHKLRDQTQVRRTLRQLTDRLKTDPTFRSRQKVEHFLESEKKKLRADDVSKKKRLLKDHEG